MLEFLNANPKENIIRNAIKDNLQKRSLEKAYEIAKTFNININNEIDEEVVILLKRALEHLEHKM